MHVVSIEITVNEQIQADVLIRFAFANTAQQCDNRSTMTWINDAEQKYRDKKAKQDTTAQLQLHKADVIRAKGRRYLDELVQVVDRDVADYRARFQGDPSRDVQLTKKPSGGFKLDKATYPAASVECFLETGSIRAVHVFRADDNSPNQGGPTHLQFQVDDNDNLTVRASDRGQMANLDQVSQYLIERVLFA